MSSTRTNLVRVVVATALVLSACLVAWWPQSASGSGEVTAQSPVALATQKTPTPTKTPTVAPPTTAAPPPAQPPAPPPAQPTKKPTKKPDHSNDNPPNLSNSGGGKGGKGDKGGKPKPPSQGTGTSSSGTSSSGSSSTSTSSGSGSTTSGSGTVAPPASSAPPATKPAEPSQAATTEAAVPPPPAPTTEVPAVVATDEGSEPATRYDTYLNSSEPVQSTSAPVWVVPGILLVLTSMLALLGGVLGRQRAVPAAVQVKAAAKRRPRPDQPDDV